MSEKELQSLMQGARRSSLVEQSSPTRRELKVVWIQFSESAFCASAGQNPLRKITLAIIHYGIAPEMSAGSSPFV